MVQDRAVVTTADQQSRIYIYRPMIYRSALFNDLERLLSQISRSRQYLTLTVQNRHVYAYTIDRPKLRTYTRPTHRCNFE